MHFSGKSWLNLVPIRLMTARRCALGAAKKELGLRQVGSCYRTLKSLHSNSDYIVVNSGKFFQWVIVPRLFWSSCWFSEVAVGVASPYLLFAIPGEARQHCEERCSQTSLTSLLKGVALAADAIVKVKIIIRNVSLAMGTMGKAKQADVAVCHFWNMDRNANEAKKVWFEHESNRGKLW